MTQFPFTLTKKQKTSRSFINFGFSTLLLSFVMICVVTFSALSFVTANADYQLSKTVAEKNQAYYAANERAYLKIAQLDQILQDAYRQQDTQKSYFSEAEHKISELFTDFYTLTETQLSFQETISDNQYLQVKVQIVYPQQANETFLEILY